MPEVWVKEWPTAPFPVDDDMIVAVRVYWETFQAAMARLDNPDVLIEQRVNITEDMWGTADLLLVEPFGALEIYDYKHGKGHVVEVGPRELGGFRFPGNPQAIYYAAAALRTLGSSAVGIEVVRVHIVQPRAPHPDGPVRTLELEPGVVREAGEWLIELASRTDAPDAPLRSGDHCLFCPAKGVCPAQREETLALLDIPPDEPAALAPPPVPDDPAELARILEIIPRWDAFVRAVEGAAQRAAEAGETIPRHKLVRKRANRAWRDAAAAARSLLEAGVGLESEDVFTEPELRGPAQIETALKLLKIKPKRRDELLADHVVKPEGGLTLVPESDKREAVEVLRVIDLLPE